MTTIEKLARKNKGEKVTYNSFYDLDMIGKPCRVVGYTETGNLLVVKFSDTKLGWSLDETKELWERTNTEVVILSKCKPTNLYFVKPEHLIGLK